MNTNENLIESLEWNNNIKNKEEKEVLARKIASKVNDGDVISFGSGTTSFLAVKEIAKRCKEKGLNIIAIPTSNQIKELCDYLEIRTAKLGDYLINWGFDGADEVDNNNWLIKGLGGAFYQEKLNLKQSPVVYILVDNSKLVEKLGETTPVPVECCKDKVDFVIAQLKELGATDCIIRNKKDSDEKYITDNGNYVVDAKFDKIVENLEADINNIDGVIENGLFIGYKNVEVITD